MAEETVWKGSPSQVINFGTYVLCALFCWLIVPIFIALAKWIETRNRVYELTTERILITTGVFTKRTDQLELYRVKDMTLEEPFWQRMFGVGEICLITSDPVNPQLVLEAVPKVKELKEQLRKNVEACRDRKRVSQLDVDQLP